MTTPATVEQVHDLSRQLEELKDVILKFRAESAGVDPEFTKEEAAKILRIGLRTVNNWISLKKLGCYYHGSKVTIGASHIRACQETCNTARKRAGRGIAALIPEPEQQGRKAS